MQPISSRIWTRVAFPATITITPRAPARYMSIIVWGGSFLGVFLDEGILSFGHLFRDVFFSASIYLGSSSVMDGSEFFKPEYMYAIMAGSFPICFSFVFFFFTVALSDSRCIFAFGPSSSPWNSFSMLVIYSAFLLLNIFPYFAQKLFCFSLQIFLPTCWQNFFRCFGMSCFVCIV